jgi:hypothetical protein
MTATLYKVTWEWVVEVEEGATMTFEEEPTRTITDPKEIAINRVVDCWAGNCYGVEQRDPVVEVYGTRS